MPAGKFKALEPVVEDVVVSLDTHPRAVQNSMSALQNLLIQTEHMLSACRALIDENSGPKALPDAVVVSDSIDVDLLEVIRDRFPEFSGGPLVVLSALILNSGRIVTHAELCSVLNTNSLPTIKVYISRIRNVLMKHDINSKISTVRGGYGISRSSVDKILAALGMSKGDVSALSSMFMQSAVRLESRAR